MSLTSKVYLDDGTGTYPLDISSRVRDWSYSRGRQDEMSEPEAGTASVTLDNTEGWFTVGNPTYNFALGQGIRINVTDGTTTWNRFTGTVDTAPLTWTSPNGLSSMVTANCTDTLAPLARRTLRSMIEETVMLGSPLAYYTLAEEDGATSAGDTSGAGNQPLTITGSGSPIAFGSGTGPGTDGLSAAMFAGGQYLTGTLETPTPIVGLCLSAFINTTATPAASQNIISLTTPLNSSNLTLGISAAGALTAAWQPLSGTSMFTSGSTINDGLTHHVALILTAPTGTATLTAYVDGVAVGTPVTSSGHTDTNYAQVTVGGGFACTLSHVAVTALVGASYVASINAAAAGLAGLTSMQAISKIADFAGIASGARSLASSPSLTSMGNLALSGTTALAAMQAIEQAEGGVVAADGAGKLVATARTTAPLNAMGTAAAALSTASPNDDVEGDLTFANDRQYLINLVTGGMTGGASQTVSDATSRAQYGDYSGSVDAPFGTDAGALNAMQWQVAAHKTPDSSRVSQVTVDLLTAGSTLANAILGVDLAEKVTVTGLPSQAPSTSLSLICEGIAEQWSIDEWTWTANTSPAALVTAWKLGDATYGVLGTTTRLYY